MSYHPVAVRIAGTSAAAIARYDWRLRIDGIDDEPIAELVYLAAESGRGSGVERLPIVRGRVSGLGGELDAIICCSDLQGIVPADDGYAELLGLAVAATLEELAYAGTIPPMARTGVVLAGDLYCVPAANKRGGYGDVAEVWQAFTDRFAWVVGVAGNHDDVSHVEGHVLDGDQVVLDGIRFGGVGRIASTQPKIGRRTEDEQLALISRALAGGVDMLVLHEGPHGAHDQPGSASVRAATSEVPLVICGHAHWRRPLAGNVLNVDARVVVLST